ncbi:hypothetical protein QTO04_24440 [Vibrio parahaemolyticus]
MVAATCSDCHVPRSFLLNRIENRRYSRHLSQTDW